MFTCAQNCQCHKLGCQGSQGPIIHPTQKEPICFALEVKKSKEKQLTKPKAKSSMQQLVKFITEAYKNPMSCAAMC